MSNDEKKRKFPRGDNFSNITTGLSGPVDKSQYTYFQRFPTLWENELDSLYEQSAIAARIVDRLVEDATREGFVLSGPDKQFDFSSLQSDIENHKILEVISKAWKQARLFGGALIVMAVNDGRRYDEPLDRENITNLIGMRVIHSFRAQPTQFNYGLGASSYLNPKYYLIQEINGKQKKIHSSRCIRIEGMPDLSDRRKIEINNGWGPSILQRVYHEISNLGQAEGYLSNIMHEASVITWKIDGLYDQLCGGDGEKDDIRRMVEETKALMDNLHVLLLDSKDTVEQANRDVTGLDKIIDKFVDALVRATSMPRLIILGEQPGGINNSADGEIRGWYDSVHATQKNFLTPIINQILEILFKIREHKGLDVPSDWTIQYNPLWQPSEQEKADTLLKEMQAYQIAVVNKFMTADQVNSLLINKGLIEDSLDKPQVENGLGLETSLDIEGVEPEPEAAPSLEPVPPDLCSTKQAAQMLGVPTLTINNMCRNGELRYWQFGSRKQVSMQDLMKAGSKVDSTNHFVYKKDANSVGLFFRIPDSVIAEAGLPPLLNDNRKIPYHMTYLVMEDIGGKYSEFEKVVKNTLSNLGKFTVSLQSTEKFGDALVMKAEFDKDLNMARNMLINILEMHGFKVNMKYPEWIPHMTLSYQTDPETGEIFDNFQVKDNFVIDQIEIWGLGDPIKIDLE